MSTFAVFGMAKHRAVELARAAVKPLRHVSEREWEARVQAAAVATMDSAREIQLSEKFDALPFAETFAALAKRDGARRVYIRAYCWNGDYDTKTKKKKYEWINIGSERERAIREKLAGAGF